MMNLRLLIENFRCIRDLDVTFDTSPGVRFIAGRTTVSDYSKTNAAGKTSMIWAMIWCLYGRFPGMSGAKALINREAKRGSAAKVHMWYPLGNTILEVVRVAKKNGTTLKFRVGIFPEDSDEGWQDFGTVTQTQDHLSERIGVGYKRYTSMLLSAGHHSVAEITSAGLKGLLAQFVPVDLGSAKPEVNKAWRAAREAEAGVLGQLDQLAAQREGVRGWVDYYGALQAAWVESSSALTTQLHDRAQSAELEAEEAAKDEAAAERVWRGAMETYEHVQQRRHMEAQMETARRGFEPVREDCPTCRQEISGAAHQSAEKRHAELRNEFCAVHTDYMARAVLVTPDLAALQSNVKAATTRRTSAQAAATQLRREAVTAASGESPHMESLSGHQSHLTALDEQIKVTQEAQGQWAGIERLYGYIHEMLQPGGLEDLMISMMLPTINKNLDAYMSWLSPDHLSSGFRDSTKTGKSKIHVGAESKVGAASYQDMSSGENRRIDLALFLGVFDLGKTIHRPPVLFIDELLDRNTDDQGREMMLNLLVEYAAQNEIAIYIVSNNPGLIANNDAATATWTITNSGKASEVSVT